MTTIPSFESYGNYSSSNYGVNALVFTDNRGVEFYFSYKTLVAVRQAAGQLFIRKNDWGPTTGKHLNAIHPDHKIRLSGDVFERAIAAL